MVENTNRIGNFTSSNIYKLMTTGKGENGFGAAATTYIRQKQIERRLGRGAEMTAYSRAIAWGNFIEDYMFKNVLSTEYEIISTITLQHPTINGWTGSPDLRTKDSIGEIKCYEPLNFANYSDCLLKQDIEYFKKEFPKEYWQIVSNCILDNKQYGEGIVYMPYESELTDIRIAADLYEGADQWKYRFIIESEDWDLPHLKEGLYYKNLNSWKFEIPQADKDLLTEKVEAALKML